MKCTFVRPDGSNCAANSVNTSSYCFMHDPASEVVRALAVKKGGLTPKKTFIHNDEEITLKDARDAKNFLAKVINGVWRGDIPATPVANTLGFLVRCLLDANEKSEIETRLDEIEKKLGEVGK